MIEISHQNQNDKNTSRNLQNDQDILETLKFTPKLLNSTQKNLHDP